MQFGAGGARTGSRRAATGAIATRPKGVRAASGDHCCMGCGYVVTVRRELVTCPMCGAAAWDPVEANEPTGTISASDVRGCRDYAVGSPDGHIGTVADVVYAAGHAEPTALAIRAGRASARLLIVPVAELVGIQPDRHRVTLRASPDVTTSELISTDRRSPG